MPYFRFTGLLTAKDKSFLDKKFSEKGGFWWYAYRMTKKREDGDSMMEVHISGEVPPLPSGSEFWITISGARSISEVWLAIALQTAGTDHVSLPPCKSCWKR